MNGGDGGGDSGGFDGGVHHNGTAGGSTHSNGHAHGHIPPSSEIPQISVDDTTYAGAAGTQKTNPSSSAASSTARLSNASAAATEQTVAKAEGKFAAFMKNEKWVGKKGLAFAAAAVALGVVAYGVSKFRSAKEEATRG